MHKSYTYIYYVCERERYFVLYIFSEYYTANTSEQRYTLDFSV